MSILLTITRSAALLSAIILAGQAFADPPCETNEIPTRPTREGTYTCVEKVPEGIMPADEKPKPSPTPRAEPTPRETPEARETPEPRTPPARAPTPRGGDVLFMSYGFDDELYEE